LGSVGAIARKGEGKSFIFQGFSRSWLLFFVPWVGRGQENARSVVIGYRKDRAHSKNTAILWRVRLKNRYAATVSGEFVENTGLLLGSIGAQS
jgi:hypothetical protein